MGLAVSSKVNCNTFQVLASLGDFCGAKNYLKRAFKMKSPVEDDRIKIESKLKIGNLIQFIILILLVSLIVFPIYLNLQPMLGFQMIKRNICIKGRSDYIIGFIGSLIMLVQAKYINT